MRLPLGGKEAPFFIAGAWRDYANQGGSVVIQLGDYRRLTGEREVTDAALWSARGVDGVWVSRLSHQGQGEALRGGVRVLFRQFGAFGDLHKRGFARTATR